MSEIKKKKNKVKIKSPPGPAEEGSSDLSPKGKKLGLSQNWELGTDLNQILLFVPSPLTG